MGKKIVITEEKLIQVIHEVLEENKEMKEALLDKITDPLKNIFYGLKGGFKTGHGYDYFNYVSKLRNIARDLKRIDRPNEQIMNKLNELRNEISVKNIRKDQKDTLIFNIDKAIFHFKNYSMFIDNLLKGATRRLKS
jgi:hypothetical protein